jgi:hypothetical protein
MSRCTTGINDLWQICHQFAASFTSVVDTGGKFATVANDTGGNLPLVSMTLVSMTPVANNRNNIRLLGPYSELEGKMYL